MNKTCMCAYVCACMCVYVNACENHVATLTIIPQVTITLAFATESLTGLEISK